MPDIFVYADKESAEKIAGIFSTFSSCLQTATAEGITELNGLAHHVNVMVLPFMTGTRIPLIQIVGMASFTTERGKDLEKWGETLVKAIVSLSKQENAFWLAEMIEEKRVEVWPTMPVGKWFPVSRTV